MILKFSGLSARDHIEILATRQIQNNRRFQCEECLKTTSKETRASWGCEKAANIKWPIPPYTITRCVGNYYSDGAQTVFELYNLFKQGFLPAKGTIADQTAWIMEAFAVCSNLDAEDEKRAKAQAQRAKRG